MLAAYYGRTEALNLLLSRGANPHLKNINGDCALRLAFLGNQELSVIALLPYYDINAVFDVNFTPLTLISGLRENRLNLVRLLVAHGAVIDLLDGNGESALSRAVMFDHYEITEYLIKQGAIVDLRNQNNRTPLMIAAAFAHTRIIQLLLKNQANPLLIDNYHESAQTYAISEGSPEVLNLLFPTPASLNDWVADRGHRPLTLAAKKNHLPLLKQMIKNGADIDQTDAHGNTALIYAIDSNTFPMVEYLVNQKASVNSQGKQKNALHLAITKNQEKTVLLLINKGKNIDINQRNNFTNTPTLIIAVQTDNLAIVQHLVLAGADLFALNSAGQSALDVAKDRGNIAIYDYLESRLPAPSSWQSYFWNNLPAIAGTAIISLFFGAVTKPIYLRFTSRPQKKSISAPRPLPVVSDAKPEQKSSPLKKIKPITIIEETDAPVVTVTEILSEKNIEAQIDILAQQKKICERQQRKLEDYLEKIETKKTEETRSLKIKLNHQLNKLKSLSEKITQLETRAEQRSEQTLNSQFIEKTNKIVDLLNQTIRTIAELTSIITERPSIAKPLEKTKTTIAVSSTSSLPKNICTATNLIAPAAGLVTKRESKKPAPINYSPSQLFPLAKRKFEIAKLQQFARMLVNLFAKTHADLIAHEAAIANYALEGALFSIAALASYLFSGKAKEHMDNLRDHLRYDRIRLFNLVIQEKYQLFDLLIGELAKPKPFSSESFNSRWDLSELNPVTSAMITLPLPRNKNLNLTCDAEAELLTDVRAKIALYQSEESTKKLIPEAKAFICLANYFINYDLTYLPLTTQALIAETQHDIRLFPAAAKSLAKQQKILVQNFHEDRLIGNSKRHELDQLIALLDEISEILTASAAKKTITCYR